MKLESLRIHRMPGIEGLALDDCGPGLNLIVGPNGVGKSSLCHALRATLWKQEGFEGSRAEARFTRGARLLRAERVGRSPARWTESGSSVAVPALPDDRFRECFTLGHESLLHTGRTESEIAGTIRLEMAAGYDLEAVLATERTPRARDRRVGAVRGELKEAQSRLAECEARQRGLLEEERGLEGLLRRRERCAEELAELPRLQEARRHSSGLEERRELVAELSAYDELCGRLGGGEVRRLAELDAELLHNAEERRATERASQEARSALEALELPEGGLEASELGAQHERLKALEKLEGELAQQRRLVAQLEGELAAMGDLPETDPGRLLSQEDEARLGELLSERQEVDGELSALDEALALVEPRPSSRKPDELRRAADALEAWLEAFGAEGSARPPRLTLFVAVVLLFLFAFGVPLQGAIGFVLTTLTLALGTVELVHGESKRRRAAEPARDKYASFGLTPPDAWKPRPVTRQLRALLDEEAALASADRQDERLKSVARRREQVASRRAGIEAECGELCAPLGLEAGGELRLLRLLRGLARRQELAGARRIVDALEEQRARYLSEIDGWLRARELPGAGTVEAAAALLADLDLRARAYREETAARARAEAEGARLSRRRVVLEEKRAGFFAALGLEPEEEPRLRRAEERLEEFRTRSEQLRVVSRRLQESREVLAGRPELLEAPATELEHLLEECVGVPEELQEVERRIADVNARLEQTRTGHELEDALSAVEERAQDLSDCREEVLRAVVLDQLLGDVEDEHRTEGQPDMLRRADLWFRRFTRDRYRLSGLGRAREHDGEPGFRAVESSTGRALKPWELSSGTRTQLLLALRLAFATSIEDDEPMPLFLDEALLTSDPVRFKEIARCLGVMVKEGRQVFYLTAEPHEVAEFRRALEGEAVDLRVHELDALRKRSVAMDAEAIPVEPLAEVPPPEGASPDEYAELLGGIPEVDPFAGVDALHLFFLFTDRLGVAWRMLRERVESVGEVRSLLERSAKPPWSQAEREQFELRTRIARRFLEAWTWGRSEPLSEVSLQASPFKGLKAIGQITDLARSVRWDGVRLLEALRDKSLREEHGVRKPSERVLIKAQEWMAERGLWTPEPPLGPEERLERVLIACQPMLDSERATREDIHQLCHRLERWLHDESEVADEAPLEADPA